MSLPDQWFDQKRVMVRQILESRPNPSLLVVPFATLRVGGEVSGWFGILRSSQLLTGGVHRLGGPV